MNKIQNGNIVYRINKIFSYDKDKDGVYIVLRFY